MNRGIVMEMKAKTLIVMAPDGHFSEIPIASRQCQVGEEIVYAEPAIRLWNRKPVAWTSGLVAAAVFCLVVFSGMQGAFASPEVVAYVSMDINPSVELGIDAKEKVRELRGLNSDGKTLIQNLDYKGKSITELTEELLNQADKTVLKDKDAADIVIASTKVKPDAKLDESQVAVQMEKQVKQHAKKTYPQKEVEVTAFPAPEAARQAAQAQDLSTGKLAIYLKAVDNGQDVTINDFKTKSVHDIAAAYGGIGKLIGEEPIRKSDIEQLVQEDINGTLKKSAAVEKNDPSRKSGEKAKAVVPSAPPKVTKRSTPTPTKPPTGTPAGSRSSPGKSAKEDNNKNDNTKNNNQKKDDTGKNDNKNADNKSDNKDVGSNKAGNNKAGNKTNKLDESNKNNNGNSKNKEVGSKPAEVSSRPAADSSLSDKPVAVIDKKGNNGKNSNDQNQDDKKNGDDKKDGGKGKD